MFNHKRLQLLSNKASFKTAFKKNIIANIYTSYIQTVNFAQKGVCIIRDGEGGELEELFIFGELEI